MNQILCEECGGHNPKCRECNGTGLIEVVSKRKYEYEKRKSRKIALQWQENLFGNGPDFMLPSICLNLRMGVNGAGDPWKDDDVKATLGMLKARLDTWEPSITTKSE